MNSYKMRFIYLILMLAFLFVYIGCGSVGRSIKVPDVIPPPKVENSEKTE